jgi:radical SAM protein with 4Fe4S-binding SPASM domain
LTISPDFKIYPCDAFKQVSSEKLKVDNDLRSVKDNLLEDCWKKSSYFEAIRDCILTEDYGECNQCSMLKKCNSGCLSQKIISNGTFKGPDPLCLLAGLEGE